MTSADVDKIVETVKEATEKAKVQEELQIQINQSKCKLIVSGYKPDPNVSGFEAAKKFLHDVLEKTDDEIQHIGLTSAEFNGVSTDWPTGVLCFKA